MECPACQTPNNDGARFCAKCGALLPAPADEVDPLIGKTVGGRYRIKEILGEGGMGRVYTAEQQMGTSVRKTAVKTLLAQYAKDPQVVARFMRECGTVAELEHPNTIKVYDYGQTDTGDLYIAMELLQGKSLESVLEGGALTPERVDRIMQQVCGSLAEAHDKGIVHRDLKPANIFLTTRAGEEDYVKVLDFGIAKKDDKHSKAEQKLTAQGTVLGTPPYMSPEQFKGQELDARSDIYSLAVMTYEMLTGRLPFDADTAWAWATQHMTAQPFPFEHVPIGGQVPPKMKHAVMRALSKEKNQRPSNVMEYLNELTIGTPRAVSRTSLGDQMMPSGVTSAGARAGGTQVGEPLFVSGVPGQPASRTVIDSSAGIGTPMQGQPSVPTGSGQAYTAPQPVASDGKKGGAGPIIAIVAVVAVLGAVGAAVLLKKGGDSSTGGAIALPSASTATTVAADPTGSTAPTSSASVKPTTSARVPPPTTATPKSDPECEAAKTQASFAVNGGLGGAIGHFKNCPASAPDHAAAKSAIGNAAVAVVKARGCAAKKDADAAAAIGEGAAAALLRSQNCK